MAIALLDNSAVQSACRDDATWDSLLEWLGEAGLTPAMTLFSVEEAVGGLVEHPFNARGTSIAGRMAETDQLSFYPEAQEGVWLDYEQPGWLNASGYSWSDSDLRNMLRRASKGQLDPGISARKSEAASRSARHYGALEAEVRAANSALNPRAILSYQDHCCPEFIVRAALGLLLDIIGRHEQIPVLERCEDVSGLAATEPARAPYLAGMSRMDIFMQWRIVRYGTIRKSLRRDLLVLPALPVAAAFLTCDHHQALVAREVFPEIAVYDVPSSSMPYRRPTIRC